MKQTEVSVKKISEFENDNRHELFDTQKNWLDAIIELRNKKCK